MCVCLKDFRLVRNSHLTNQSISLLLGINVTNGDEVAVKLESSKARHPQLIYEARVYKVLQGGMGMYLI